MSGLKGYVKKKDFSIKKGNRITLTHNHLQKKNVNRHNFN